jgi:Na+-transporting NADH:ubiquinone oxidoreductase subunit E
MENLISIALNSVFVGNILLAYFLGMCSFLAVSKNLETSIGLGVSVVFVLTITTPINWLIYHFLLAPGALAWAGLPDIDLSFLKLVLFIAVIAGIVQIVEMVIDRYSDALYNALGVYLPLITVNCAVMGTSLFMVEREYTFGEAVVFGIGSGAGWMLAIVAMAAIMNKLRYADVPKGLQGFAISMIVTGLMAMSFMLFAGITLPGSPN